MNANYTQPSIPARPEVPEGFLRGLYRLLGGERAQVQLLGPGAIMMEVLTARELLRWDWGIEAAVWSVTSYAELHRDGIECERRARLHPESPAAQPFVTRTMSSAQGPVIGVTDYVRAVPELIRAFVPHRYVTLGTDGFGWRDTRDALRAFFELDAASIVIAALKALVDEGSMEPARAAAAIARYGRDPVSLPQWSR